MKLTKKQLSKYHLWWSLLFFRSGNKNKVSSDEKLWPKSVENIPESSTLAHFHFIHNAHNSPVNEFYRFQRNSFTLPKECRMLTLKNPIKLWCQNYFIQLFTTFWRNYPIDRRKSVTKFLRQPQEISIFGAIPSKNTRNNVT